MGRRLTRKQIRRDEFVTLVDRVVHWFGENWRQAAIAGGVVVLLGLLWWGGSLIVSSRSGGASAALASAMELYEAPVGADAPADAKVKFTTDTERLDASEKAFKSIVSRYWLTPERRTARLFLARIAAARGDTEAATRMLTEISSRRSDDPLTRVATLDLIRLRVASGEGPSLVSELEEMIAGKDPRLPRDVALFELAQLWEREGKSEEAARLFRKLVQDFPESPYRSDAQQRLAGGSYQLP